MAKIPGIYKANDAGIAFNKCEWMRRLTWALLSHVAFSPQNSANVAVGNNPKSYVVPGPKVWSGN